MLRMPVPRRILSFVFVAAMVLSVTRCEQTIEPLVGEDRPFTLWGFLDAHADTQRVRVFTIEQRLGTDRGGPIDAVVTSTNIGTGEVIEWTDEEVVFSDSSVGHVFYAAFRASYESSYRLDVRRPDGATASATVTIPPAVRVELVDAPNRIVVPVFIHGKPPNLVGVNVLYDAATLPPANPWPPGTPAPPGYELAVSVPYDGQEEPTDDGWYFEVNLRSDFAIIQDTYTLNCLSADHIGLRRIKFQFLAADEQWAPPGGSFDPNLLIEPGAFSNVENGYGFFGGGYSVSEGWLPSLVVQRSVGFRTDGPCPLTPANIPECQLPPEPCFRDGRSG